MRTQQVPSKNQVTANRLQETKEPTNITGPGETSVTSHDEVSGHHVGHIIHSGRSSKRKDVTKRH